MKRRLNIACSLLHQPQLVLLDEPTVGVDPQSRERIYEMLAELQRAGVSIVLTTHHLEEAERRCERIVIIDHGRIVASGTLPELLTADARRAAGSSRCSSPRPFRRRRVPRRREPRRRARLTHHARPWRTSAATLPRCSRRWRRPARRVADVQPGGCEAAGRVHCPHGAGVARMIATLLRIGWINLRRDRVAQAMTFVLPIMFFSIFAMVFGNQRNPTQKVDVAVVDEDRSAYSTRARRRRSRPRAACAVADDGARRRPTGPPLDRAPAEALVKDGHRARRRSCCRRAWATAPSVSGAAATRRRRRCSCWPTCRIRSRRRWCRGCCRRSASRRRPTRWRDEGIAMFERYGGPLTPAQRQSGRPTG